MERLYFQISEELLNSLKAYKNGQINYKQLKHIFESEDTLYNVSNWDSMEKDYRKEIFDYQAELYKHLLEVEKNIEEYEMLNKDEEVEMNIEQVSMHANMLSRSAEPPVGFENSPWYLPPFPTLEMIEALHEEDS